MSYHGLLDWRLGLGLVRLLHDATYASGLDGNFSAPELVDWPSAAGALRDGFAATFGGEPTRYGPLPGLRIGRHEIVIVHPLWNTSSPQGLLLESVASIRAVPDHIRYLDTFNLLRRPSWLYQNIPLMKP